MKLNQEVREVTTNTSNIIRGGMMKSAKAVKLVVNDMYSDKPRSIARELMSNAFDSHVEAGCPDKPFEVTVPTWLDPTFRVRDFGTGMSRWTIENVYAVLFKSTKEDTNEALGKWGLGSKTPLSYVDSYSLTSYYQGVKSYYTVMFDVDGDISIVPMGDEQTTEPNGVEVSFPVKGTDYEQFKTALREAAVGHDVKPVVTNAHEVGEFEDPTPTSSGVGWKLFESGYISGPHAKMGCVVYPINLSSLGIKPYQDRSLYYALNRNLLLEFNIGELEVTSSRESLSYGASDPTKDAILKKAQKFIDSYEQEALKDIEKSTCLSEAVCKTSSATSSQLVDSKTFRAKTKWGSYSPVPDQISLPCEFHCDFTRAGIIGFYKTGGFKAKKSLFAPDLSSLVLVVASKEKGSKDMRVKPRVVYWWKERYKSSGSVKSPSVLLVTTTNTPEEQKALEQLKKDLGDSVKTFYVKDFPDPDAPDPSDKTPRKRTKVKAKRLCANGETEPVTLDKEEMEKGGFFVKTDRYQLVGTEYSLSTLGLAIEAGIIDKVTVVPKTLWSRFEGSQWKTPDQAIKAWAEKDKEQRLKDISFHSFKAYGKDYHRTKINQPQSVLDLASKYIKVEVDYKPKYPLCRKEKRLYQHIGELRTLADYESKFREEAEGIYQDFYKRYPLLTGAPSQKEEHKELYILAVEKGLKDGTI